MSKFPYVARVTCVHDPRGAKYHGFPIGTTVLVRRQYGNDIECYSMETVALGPDLEFPPGLRQNLDVNHVEAV
jgi:hypothetical protein